MGAGLQAWSARTVLHPACRVVASLDVPHQAQAQLSAAAEQLLRQSVEQALAQPSPEAAGATPPTAGDNVIR